MKINIVASAPSIFFGALFTSLLFASSAYATVGGPTLVYSFTYNPADESAYYIQLDQGGRGCPPELRKISLATGAVSTVYSCDQGEALLQSKGTSDTAIVMTEIGKITSTFKNLTPIDLKKNGITVDVNFVREEILTNPDDGVWRRQFNAVVEQNNVSASAFPLTGCSATESFLFSGYAIPGFDKKIILLSSGKGNCMEGGYINESLHVVGGVTGLDKTPTSDLKGPSPLIASASTLRVNGGVSTTQPATTTPPVGTSTIGTSSTGQTESENNSIKTVLLALLGVIAIGLGFFAGKFAKTQRLSKE